MLFSKIMTGHYKKVNQGYVIWVFFSGKVFWEGFYEEKKLEVLEGIQSLENEPYQTIEQ